MNAELWLCAIFLLTFKEGSNGGGPLSSALPVASAAPKSIGLKGTVNSAPLPAKGKEKLAGLSQRAKSVLEPAGSART